jgi:hypothetical protein
VLHGRRAAPGGRIHHRAAALKLGAGGAVQYDDLAGVQALLETIVSHGISSVGVSVAVLSAVAGNHIGSVTICKGGFDGG